MQGFVLRPWMPNLRIISLLILAGVSYASIVTDSATLKANSRNIVTDSWRRHSSACDLDRTSWTKYCLQTSLALALANFIYIFIWTDLYTDMGACRGQEGHLPSLSSGIWKMTSYSPVLKYTLTFSIVPSAPWAPAGIFPEGAKTAWTGKNDLISRFFRHILD